jgi:hypothetical protein
MQFNFSNHSSKNFIPIDVLLCENSRNFISLSVLPAPWGVYMLLPKMRWLSHGIAINPSFSRL